MKKTIITFILFMAIFGSAVFGEKKEELTETAMVFWTVCNSIPMHETINGYPPASSKELIQFFEEMGKKNEGIRRWVSILKEGSLTVVDQKTIEADDPYIQFQAKGEKDIYILLKSGAIRKN